MNNNFPLGSIDGELFYLRAPSFDCEWYVGFGYIGNNNTHMHLDGLLDETKENWHDAMLKIFGDSLNPAIKEKLWEFCDLMKSFYSLKDTYEVYHSGSSHLTMVKELDLKNVKMAVQIMKDIFRVCNEVCKMLNLKPLEWSEEIERKVSLSCMPTTFTRNKYPYPKGKKYTLFYLSPYDPKTISDYRKEMIIPKGFKAEKKKCDVGKARFNSHFEGSQ